MTIHPSAAGHHPEAHWRTQVGQLKLAHAWVLAGVLVTGGVALKLGLSPSSGTGRTDAARATVNSGPQEVDFGLVELTPSQPTPVTSYKNGGNMVLYAGEELRFEVLGGEGLAEASLPAIELRTGSAAQLLPGASGTLRVEGLAGQAMPATMVSQGSRHSLPGGAPPRVSVKVQVYGNERPK